MFKYHRITITTVSESLQVLQSPPRKEGLATDACALLNLQTSLTGEGTHCLYSLRCYIAINSDIQPA